MNAQFHTPSFGDEIVFDLPDNETDCRTTIASVQGGAGSSTVPNKSTHQQQKAGVFPPQPLESKRIRNMDVSTDEYHSANDESFANTAYAVSPPKSAQSTPTATLAARKQLTPTATNANEPAKPLSAYGLFFRDTVSAIKQQNPNCTFQELSRIVLSMWEALDASHKNVYSKKHEAAMNEYIKQMRIYQQQQEEQQQQQQQQQQLQQQQLTTSVNATPTPALQTKPAVFTISRFNTDGNSNANYNNVTTNNDVVANATQPQLQAQAPTQIATNTATSTTTTANAPTQPQIQLLSEAGAVQKCTRENCNKRAIINPDWEDEYCSNECVVIHCRNVFNAWVQSNLESRKQ
ncbi:PREDICTED: TOX high mobility group box family member 4 [Rhagoletis zephyria]|uniref:TOX high mobility group box family member 4 n=1 Tax=Rhagoletis zephyria TaxID=28612 RepID=UPI0008118E1A|nr:PREDICTED: TOX high mobility group box family member 4 [Rhagoletis zephyria]